MPAITSIQLLLIGVITTLTLLLSFIGVQVILILSEVRRAAKKLHTNASINQPATTTTGVLQILLKQQFNSVAQIDADALPQPTTFNHFALETLKAQQTVLAQESFQLASDAQTLTDSYPHITALQERGRQIGKSENRVFHRAGKPLA